jgi:hypothetical protein
MNQVDLHPPPESSFRLCQFSSQKKSCGHGVGKMTKNSSIWLTQAKIKIKTNQEFPGEKTGKIRWGE